MRAERGSRIVVGALNGCLEKRGVSAGREVEAEVVGSIASREDEFAIPIANGPFTFEKEESI